MIDGTLGMLNIVKVRLPLQLDSFEQLNATMYVTGIESTHDLYFRQGWADQEEWRFGTGDSGEGKLSINSATMRFSGYVPLLGGVYVTGKCEKIFRRAFYETESNSAEFNQELREQGVDVRP